MKLLVEDAAILESNIVEEISESGIKEKNYYIEGIFSTMGEKNRNGRIYSQKLWEDNVKTYQKEIQENTINTLGECEHPSRVAVDPMKAVMKITELFVEGKYVKGKARILNNNMDETNQIKALIDVGMPIGVSSRGTGIMKGEIVEAFELRTYDIVQSPSDYNANLQGIRESVEKNVTMNEETNDYVCENGECMLETKEIVEEIVVEDAKECCSKKVDSLIEALNIVANQKEITAIKQADIELQEKFDSFVESKDITKEAQRRIKKNDGVRVKDEQGLQILISEYKDGVYIGIDEMDNDKEIKSLKGYTLDEAKDPTKIAKDKIKKDGEVMMINDKGILVSFTDIDGDTIVGIDQHDNDVEVTTLKGYTLAESKDKLTWKKIGDQFTVFRKSEPKDVLGMVMKQAKNNNDQSASYEVQDIDGIEFKKFPKIKDAKKYVEDYINSKSEGKNSYKVGDKITTKLDKKEQLHGRTGKVKEVGDNTLVVDFGNGDSYGINYNRLKGNVIVEGKMNEGFPEAMDVLVKGLSGLTKKIERAVKGKKSKDIKTLAGFLQGYADDLDHMADFGKKKNIYEGDYETVKLEKMVYDMTKQFRELDKELKKTGLVHLRGSLEASRKKFDDFQDKLTSEAQG